MITLYGIPNCDTVKKARAYLQAHGQSYHFHDYKKQGVPKAFWAECVSKWGWESLLNRQGSTWRKLSDAEKQSVLDEESAYHLASAYPSIIKRPLLLSTQGTGLLGFNESDYGAWLSNYAQTHD